MKTHHSGSILLAGALSLLPLQPLSAAKWAGFSTDWDSNFAWWPDAMPDEPGAVADFSALDYSAKNDVFLNGDRTIGSLVFGDTAAPIQETHLLSGTPEGGHLILDNSGSGVLIDTLVSSDPPPSGFNRPPAPATSVRVPVIVNDDLTLNINTGPVTPTSPTWFGLVFYESVSEAGGARSLTVDGNGRGITGIFKSLDFTGGTTVNAGSIQIGAEGTLGTGAITINSGGQAAWFNDRTLANDITITGNGFIQPEGQRGALYFERGIQTLTGTLQLDGNARIEGNKGTTAVIAGPLTGSSNLEINALNGGTNPINGSSNLENRSGTFRLEGDASGFTGKIAVSRGHLELLPGSNPGGDLSVSIAASLGGEGAIAGDLTIGTPGPPGPQPMLFIDPTSSGALHVGGDLDLKNITMVSLLNHPPLQTSKVMSYAGSLSGGSANLELEGGLANYRAGTEFDFTSTPGEVLLHLVTGDLLWNAGTAEWNTTGMTWTGGDTFHQLDDVTFDDTVTGGSLITVTDTLYAGTIHFNNSAGNDYTLHAESGGSTSPTGHYIASGKLIKDGAGELTIGATSGSTHNRHTYAGGTVINEGRIRVLQSGSAGLQYGPLGSGPITMNGGSLSGRSEFISTLHNPLVLNADVTLGEAGEDKSFSVVSSVTLGADILIDTPSNVTLGKRTDPTMGVTDGGSGHSLTKTGSGVLEMGSTNSWGGSTTIQNGEMRFRGPTTSGAFTVENGASLSGDATLTANVLVESGAVITASNGSFNLLAVPFSIDGDLELAGTFLCDIDNADADRINVSGDLDISNGSLQLETIEAPSDSDQVHLIASYGTLTGETFSNVTGLPEGRVLNYAYDDGSGTKFIAITPLPSAYQSWASARGLVEGVNADASDDPNQDGRTNLEHFAFDTDPLGDGSDEGKSRLAVSGDGDSEDYFTLTVPVLNGAVFGGSPLQATAGGIVYQVWGDADLEAPFELEVVELTPALSSGLPDLGDYDGIEGADWTYHTFRLSDPLTAHAKAFLQLSVEENP